MQMDYIVHTVFVGILEYSKKGIEKWDETQGCDSLSWNSLSLAQK